MSTLKQVSKIRDETENLFYNSNMPNRALLKDVSFVNTIYENSNERYNGKLINNVIKIININIHGCSFRNVGITCISNNVPTKESFD